MAIMCVCLCVFVCDLQEGAVSGQEVPRRLPEAPQLQTERLVQLHGEADEEAQRPPETAHTQQEVCVSLIQFFEHGE